MQSTEHLEIGYKIGNHYEIIEVLGQGGFGIVYLVKDNERLGEILVIKELFAKNFSSRHINGKSVNNRINSNNIFNIIKKDIIEEVNILKRINNENIVKAYGYFEDNNTIYSIMEFIKGEDLEKYSKKNSFDEDRAKELLRQLINGLKEIHSQNIIHRDIKPNNIIKTPDGIYKIIDFTTNRSYSDGKMTTMTGFQNPIYTPPELTQKKAIIGNYTDIYSMGMTIISLLVKYRNNLSNLTDRLLDDSEFQRAINRLNISEDFRNILIKMTEIKPENRFQDLQEIESLLSTSKTHRKRVKNLNVETEVGFDDYEDKIKTLEKSNSWFKKAVIVFILSVISYGGYYEYQKHKPMIQKILQSELEPKPSPIPTLTPPSKPSPLPTPTPPSTKKFTEQNIRQFLQEFVVSGESNSPQKILKYYAPKVSPYFSLSNASRDDIFKDKTRFYKKWTTRRNRLVEFTIVDKYTKNGINYCSLTETIEWESQSSSESKSGTSVASIELKSENNRFQITSIYTLSNKIKSTKTILTPRPIITLEFNYRNIEKFLKDFLRTKEGDSAENIANYFSPIVEKFRGKSYLTTEDIIERKRKWINMWKSREFRLVKFKILNTYSKNGIEYCDLEEIVNWRHQKSDSEQYVSGTDTIGITIKKSVNSFKITSIYGINNMVRKKFNRENIKKSLLNFLRTKEGNSAEKIANYFSSTVKNYYGTHNLTTKDIVKRKQNWIDMWKSRQFKLVNFQILKTYSKDGVEYCDLKEHVAWKHSKKDSKPQLGSSTIFMTLKKENNDFKIISIYLEGS